MPAKLQVSQLCRRLALLASIGSWLAPSVAAAHHHHSSHSHSYAGYSGGLVIYSAGPVISGPNFLLGYSPSPLWQPLVPPLVNPGLQAGQGALLPPVAGGMGGINPGVGALAGGNAGLAGLAASAGGGGFSDPPQRPRVRVASNAPSRTRAGHFVNFGDEHFRKQKYNEALERYKDASRSAPDLAEPYFRQAFALAAMNKYELAVRALRHGLSIDGNWPAAPLRLEQLYADNRLAKLSHREAMAKAALADPFDADVLFLLGVELYCDGQQQRSRAFFERAKTLEPGDPEHIRAFLSRLDAAKAAGQQL